MKSRMIATAMIGAARKRYGRALPAGVLVLSIHWPTRMLPAMTKTVETIGSAIEKMPNCLSVRPMTSA